MHRGFTIVELIITITVMVILLALGVASFQNSQVYARDNERKTDVESIARHLDTLYSRNGTPINCHASGQSFSFQGSYPPLSCILYEPSQTAVFKGLPPATLIDPQQNSIADTLKDAINNNTPSVSSTTINKYIYQPLTNSGAVCWTTSNLPCTGFRFYWYKESDGSFQTVKSRYQ